MNISIIYYQNAQGAVTAIITSIPALDVELFVKRLRMLPSCQRAHLVMTCDRVFNIPLDTKAEVGTIESL